MWLTINLCNILYIFISIVFLHILLVEHETSLGLKKTLWIEASILATNCEHKFEISIRRFRDFIFFRLSFLHLFVVSSLLLLAAALSRGKDVARGNHAKRADRRVKWSKWKSHCPINHVPKFENHPFFPSLMTIAKHFHVHGHEQTKMRKRRTLLLYNTRSPSFSLDKFTLNVFFILLYYAE